MPSLQAVLSAIERLAPPEFMLPGDKIGFQVGNRDAAITKAVVSLDRSMGAVRFCVSQGAHLLLSHHPLIYYPLNSVTADDEVGRTIQALLSAGICHVAAHTNWDCAPNGLNDALASRIGLTELTPFGSRARLEMVKLVVFAPERAVEAILDAAGDAGAGKVGEYNRCGFYSPGTGAFEASASANPTVGKRGERNTVGEFRLEMVLPAARRAAVEAAVRAVHPYEEPVIDFLAMAPVDGHPAGRKGRLAKPVSPAEFVPLLDKVLGTRTLGWVAGNKPIEWVGVVGGAADDDWRQALAAGCDAFVTGEVKQHNALEATALGMHVFCSGHYATEQPGVEYLAARLSQAMPEVEWMVYAPEPGTHGRPL